MTEIDIDVGYIRGIKPAKYARNPKERARAEGRKVNALTGSWMEWHAWMVQYPLLRADPLIGQDTIIISAGGSAEGVEDCPNFTKGVTYHTTQLFSVEQAKAFRDQLDAAIRLAETDL